MSAEENAFGSAAKPASREWPIQDLREVAVSTRGRTDDYPEHRGLTRAARILAMTAESLTDFTDRWPQPPSSTLPQLTRLRSSLDEITFNLRLLGSRGDATLSAQRQSADDLIRLSADVADAMTRVSDLLYQDTDDPAAENLARNYLRVFLEERDRAHQDLTFGELDEDAELDLFDEAPAPDAPDAPDDDLEAGDKQLRPASSLSPGMEDGLRRLRRRREEAGLAVHFGYYAGRQTRAANVLRSATVAVIVAITALTAVLLVVGEASGDTSAGETLAKLSVTLPLAALAGYLAREASRHRQEARWAGELEVQLLSVDAYSQTLSDPMKDQLRLELGRRVFTSGIETAAPNAAAGDATSAQGPSVLADTAGLIEQVAGLIKSTTGRSGAPPPKSDAA